MSPTRFAGAHLPMLGSALALSTLGVVMVFSAQPESASGPSHGMRQLAFLGLGLLVGGVGARPGHRRLRRLSAPLAVSVAIALALVLTPLGHEVRGTRGWFRLGTVSVQPSEFAKLALVLTLAVVLSVRVGRRPGIASGPVRRSEMGRLAAATLPVGVLSGLVLAQGETGTVLVFAGVAGTMLAVAGIPARYLVALVVAGLLIVGVAIDTGALAPYQVARLQSFVDPDLDPQGTGYNQRQAMAAVGSGGLTGAGLFEGPQTQLGYLPDQHTDFIFAVVAEELGLIGALMLIGLEGVVLASIVAVAHRATTRFERLLCTGVFAIVAVQLVQNVAMNVRLAPIVGISLPFVSYGGSSLVMLWAGLGLVHGVHRRGTVGSRIHRPVASPVGLPSLTVMRSDSDSIGSR